MRDISDKRIAEDKLETIRSCGDSLLEMYGCKVEIAANGVEAVEKVKEGHSGA